jgi:hypothetical protein
MSIKKIAIVILVIASPVIALQSCYKVATVIPATDVEVTGPVSFAKDIIPVLHAKCSISGCHASGGHIPNLVDDKAFASLSNGGYLNMGSPENSSLYLWLTGKKGTIMPPGGPNNPSNINQLVLAWIKQGAQNN